MCALIKISEDNSLAYLSWWFAIYLVFSLTYFDFGRAGIIVYENGMVVEEFPDIDLPYTQSVRRNGIEGVLVAANPLHACVTISRPPDENMSINWFVLMSGNSCAFETKVLNAQSAGYSLGVIYTHRGRVEDSSGLQFYGFFSAMPAIAVKSEHGIRMKENYLYNNTDMRYKLFVFPNYSFNIMTFLLIFSVIAGLFLVIMLAFTVFRFLRQSTTLLNSRLSSEHLQQLQTMTFQKGDGYEMCAICLEDYKEHDKLRILPCSHGYHMKCIDPWLTKNKRICPVCKRKVILVGETSTNATSENFGERAETTPLLQASRGGLTGSCSTFSSLNVPATTNTHCSNLPIGQLVAGNEHFMPDVSLPPERHHDRQCVLHL